MVCDDRTAARSAGGSSTLVDGSATGSAAEGDDAITAGQTAAARCAGAAGHCGTPASAKSKNSKTGNERSSTLRRPLIAMGLM